MDGAVGRANDQRRLDPRAFAHARRQIGCAHHQEEPDERRFTLSKDDGTPSDDGSIRRASGTRYGEQET